MITFDPQIPIESIQGGFYFFLSLFDPTKWTDRIFYPIDSSWGALFSDFC